MSFLLKTALLAAVLLTGTTVAQPSYNGTGPDFYGIQNKTGVNPQSYIKLTGSGSTLTAKLVYRVMQLLDQRTKPTTMMHLRAVGSGTGRQELGVLGQSGSNVNIAPSQVQNLFATSDVPVSASSGINASIDFVHFPIVTAAVSIFYNLPVTLNGYALNLTVCTISDIFSGRCTTWDCAAIASLNPNLAVPTLQPIYIGYRSDNSGTSTVFSSWLDNQAGAGPAKCASSEGTTATHIFGPSATTTSTRYASTGSTTAGYTGNKYFYSGSSSGAAATNAPSNAASFQGTAGVISFVQATQWSITYVDNGQALEAGLSEAAIYNGASFVLSANANLSASWPSSIPWPTDSTASWSAVVLLNAGSGNLTFPIVTFSYIIIPRSYTAYSNTDAEGLGLLMALIQYLYYPEAQAGYNSACGYASNGSLTVSTTAYTCSSYVSPSMLSTLGFTPLPAYWIVAVLTALQNVIPSGGMLGPFVSGGTSAQIYSNVGTPVPTWTFEPTENALLNAAGSLERCISYNRLSYADFMLDQNAVLIAQNQQNIAFLTSSLIGGDRGIVLRMFGSGSSLQSRLVWHALELMVARANFPIRCTYRSIGSGNGVKEFMGQASNGYMPYVHFGSTDALLSSTNYNTMITNGKKVLTIPILIGAVSLFHTVPPASITAGKLNLTAQVICGIYNGTISNWNNAKIAALNPNLVVSGSKPITVVIRADGGGTSTVFTTWMSVTCPGSFSGWLSFPGSGASSATSLGFWNSAVSNGAHISPQTNSLGVTTFLAPGIDNGDNVTTVNPWAIGYVDAGFGTDFMLTESAIELKVNSGVFAACSDLGLNGFTAPHSGYPTSSLVDWASSSNWAAGPSSLFNQWSGAGQQIWPILTFSWVYIRQDMTQLGESGRLVTAFIKMLFSSDSGYPSTVSTPNLYAFYGDFLFSQPPLVLINQVLSDLSTKVVFAPGTSDWRFENSGYNGTANYLVYNGAGDRYFSVWRSNLYPDYWYMDQMSQVTNSLGAQIANLQKQFAALNASLFPANGATTLGTYSHDDTGEVIAFDINFNTFAVNQAQYTSAFSAAIAHLLHVPSATIQVTNFQQTTAGGNTKVFFNVVLAGTSSSSSEVVIASALNVQSLFTSATAGAAANSNTVSVFKQNGLPVNNVFYQDQITVIG